MQIQQTPHLLAQMTTPSDLLLTLNSMLEQRTNLPAAGTGTLWVVTAASMDQQRKRLLQLLTALNALLLCEARAHLVTVGKVSSGLQQEMQQKI